MQTLTVAPKGYFRGRRRASRRDGEAGFTLVEMLVVITIIGLIMGLVGPRVLNYLSESKVKAATIQIESLDGALDLYFLDLGRYPTTAQGLAALVQRPGGASGWKTTAAGLRRPSTWSAIITAAAE